MSKKLKRSSLGENSSEATKKKEKIEFRENDNKFQRIQLFSTNL